MIKIGKTASNISVYSYEPDTKKELRDIIKQRISKEGPNCNLNDIGVNKITDMSMLFYGIDFNGDISEWDVSRVTHMNYMFEYTPFNGDISNWDTSSVREFTGMFFRSKFNNDISRWDVSRAFSTSLMFAETSFNQDISNWIIPVNCNVYRMLRCSQIKEEYKPKSLRKK